MAATDPTVAAAGGPAAAAEGQVQTGEAGNGIFGSVTNALSVALRMYLIYCILQTASTWMSPGPSAGMPSRGAAGGGSGGAVGSGGLPGEGGLIRRNIFRRGELLDMTLFISESPHFSEEDPTARLLWQQNKIALCQDEARLLTYKHTLSTELQSNGSAFLHVFFARAGYPTLPSAKDFHPEHVFSYSYALVRYMALPKRKEVTNLWSGSGNQYAELEGEADEESNSTAAATDMGGIVVGHWKPNVTIALVEDFTAYPDAQIPPPIREHMVIDPYSGNYYPTVWFNDFWLLKEHLLPLNDTVPEVDLFIELTYAHVFKWQMLKSMDEAFEQQQSFGGMGEHEADMIKRIFIESNPYFLALTMAVSLLHTVFDLLAFKSDIGFWRSNKSMEGLSARSILINSACQLVVFLYLLDNETSYTVLFSSGLGLALEFWKITKAMQVSLTWRAGFIPVLKFEDRLSYATSKTKQYDAEAIRYLSYALYPLVGCYAVYALMYRSHRSWYSWVLNSLVGAVYAFGFILMCPQLYLNYKLKSVAHMPWRQMTYKFLNTIVDDLFAFVIKMPFLHRLSVFRDDLIFCIFLYQRWIYRVDNTRVNEFGFSAEKPPEDAAGVGGVVNEITDGAAVAEEELAGGDDGGVEPSSLRRRGAAVGVSGEKLTSGVGSISGQQEQQRAGDSGDEGAGVEDSAHEKAS